MKFELHTLESAPKAILSELEAAQKAYGSIPNLYRGLASNPATLKIYLSFNENLKAHGVLSPIEQQVVYLTISAENDCSYCVGAHSVLADMAKIPELTLLELREEKPLTDHKLDALRTMALSIVKSRGWVSPQDIEHFEEAGYSQHHYLEVLTIVAQKTLSNYFNHLAHTPLDSMFQSRAWTK